MLIKGLEQFDLPLYTHTLDNGLLINIVPKNNVNNIYVTFSTRYGSVHDEFIPIDSNDYYKVPLGVAHFLEHKVFEQEDLIDPFTIFSSNGADANANTSSYKTTYLFSGPNNFEENLNFLLDFVQNPYFTDDNVEKEKGIIEQELKMLNDRPYWYLYEKSLMNSFVNHPIRYPVGGTLDSIKEITKEDLYKCYNTFYHPSNMFITISGNVDAEETIRLIEENQNKKKFSSFKEIKIKKYDEPDKVYKEYDKVNFDLSIPKVSFNYKINIKDYDINILRLYLNIYFSLLLDSTSLLDEELRNKNIISSEIYYESVYTEEHILYMLNFESNEYNIVLDKLKDLIGKTHVSEEELDRKKKVFKSSYMYRSDNIYSINSKIDNDIIRYNEVRFNDFDIIDSLNINEMNSIIDSLDFSNTSLLILENE